MFLIVDYTSVYGDSVYSDSGIGSRSSSMESLIFGEEAIRSNLLI